ncbi:hypothetical protein C8F04DRAFT_1191070 [Mycena alexandri]|uniref:Uncharacterized protein n=1 Tax=Mycena alexandri TaxID=1745969 RepID=A0AAD6SEJ9_9AGAR|nr:hypothetical protein C8F04DRAFT_1191070 [Mycena alexandri]
MVATWRPAGPGLGPALPLGRVVSGWVHPTRPSHASYALLISHRSHQDPLGKSRLRASGPGLKQIRVPKCRLDIGKWMLRGLANAHSSFGPASGEVLRWLPWSSRPFVLEQDEVEVIASPWFFLLFPTRSKFSSTVGQQTSFAGAAEDPRNGSE